jgi:excisionase family DNA binding protein
MCDRPQLSNAEQMAQRLGIKPNTWRDLARRRHLPHFRIGRAVRWDEEQILELLREEPD